MKLTTTIPAADKVKSYVDLIQDAPVLYVGIAVGLIIGFILTVLAYKRGWFSDKRDAVIARLEQKLENRIEENKDLIEELRPMREHMESKQDQLFDMLRTLKKKDE